MSLSLLICPLVPFWPRAEIRRINSVHMCPGGRRNILLRFFDNTTGRGMIIKEVSYFSLALVTGRLEVTGGPACNS